jgi:RNA polymerase sigma factor (sigma-70 family)
MATNRMNKLVGQLRRTALAFDGAGQTDGRLLGRFIEERDDAAFEALVRRHGPMVLGVCRRILRHEEDSQDAFQATFLVLVRKAGSVVPREMVGNWLYGVAQQTAIRVRAMTAKRQARERQMAALPDVADRQNRDDLATLLDEELARLPEKYRAVIVLCDLEGRTRKEVAKQLGWPEGSVATRLFRGRALLARRLARQGLLLSAEILAVSVTQNAASATVPPALVSVTVKAAAALAAGNTAASFVSTKVAAITQGVVMSLFISKLKTLAVTALMVCALGVGVGTGWLSGQTPGEEAQPPMQRQGGAQKKAKGVGKTASEKERLAQLENRLELAQAHFQAELATIRRRSSSYAMAPTLAPSKPTRSWRRECFLRRTFLT